MSDDKWTRRPQTFKVTYTAIEVKEPRNYRSQRINTTWKCGFVKPGDKITLTYPELCIEESDSVCYTTLINWTGSGRGRKGYTVEGPPAGWGWEPNPGTPWSHFIECEDPFRPVVYRIDEVEPVDLSEKYPLLRPASERPNWDDHETTEQPVMGVCPEKDLAALLRMPFDSSARAITT